MTEELWLVVAGLVAPFVIQVVKRLHTVMFGGELSHGAALAWTYVVALVFAGAAKVVAGEVVIPAGDPVTVVTALVTHVTAVIGLATVIYKSVLPKLGLA